MTDSYALDLSTKPLELLEETAKALLKLTFTDGFDQFNAAVQNELESLFILYADVHGLRSKSNVSPRHSPKKKKTEVQPKPVKKTVFIGGKMADVITVKIADSDTMKSTKWR